MCTDDMPAGHVHPAPLLHDFEPSVTFDLEPVDGNQFAIELSQIDMEGAHCGAIDNADQHAAARLDGHHLGIVEAAIVRKKSIVFHIVQIRLGAASHLHACH